MPTLYSPLLDICLLLDGKYNFKWFAKIKIRECRFDK